jgi:lantibiotic biosynthesis protein
VSRERAAEVVALVAERLADPAAVASTTAAAVDRHAGGQATPAWQPATLAEGHPGIALLQAELGDRQAAHAHLAAAGRSSEPAPGGHRLLAGRLPGLLFAASAMRRRPGDYAGLLDRAGPVVADAVRRTAAAELERVGRGATGTRFAVYDVLAGLSGASRLLLACGTEPAALDDSLRALVALTAGRQGPGWYVEHGWSSPDDPTAHVNLGLAHGVPGVLAALSVAYREGTRVPGHAEAIERIATWLLAVGPDWPEILGSDGSVLAPAGRPSWCYGVPGLARALQLAGLALDEAAWRATATGALRAVLARPWAGFDFCDAGLCHGWGGLLQVTLRMAWDGADERLAAAADGLADRVVGYFSAEAPFGFRYATGGEVRMAPDRPGLLWGSAGAALALQTYAGGHPPSTGWDAALLLA